MTRAIVLIFCLRVATLCGIVIAFLALGGRQLEEGVVLEDGHSVEDTVAVELSGVAVRLIGKQFGEARGGDEDEVFVLLPGTPRPYIL